LLDPATNHWTVVSDVPAGPHWSQGAGLAYDSRRNRVVMFAPGFDSASSPELWAYSVPQKQWTRLADCPMAAGAPGFDYDSNHDIFLALIGTYTWVYNPTNDGWSQIQATIRRVPEGHTNLNNQPVTYDPAHDVFVFEGGNIGYEPAQWILFRYSGSSLP